MIEGPGFEGIMKSKEGIEFPRTRGVKQDFSARTITGTSALELEQKEMAIKQEARYQSQAHREGTPHTLGFLNFL